eukprot:12846539-Ditylum_brightwellii.AAC.1
MAILCTENMSFHTTPSMFPQELTLRERVSSIQQRFLIPTVDIIIAHKNCLGAKRNSQGKEVIDFMKEAYVFSGERDIYIGDALEIKLVTEDSMTRKF